MIVIDRQNDKEYLADIYHVYYDPPEVGYNGFMEVEFLVYDNQKDVTHEFNQDTLNDMEQQIIHDILFED